MSRKLSTKAIKLLQSTSDNFSLQYSELCCEGSEICRKVQKFISELTSLFLTQYVGPAQSTNNYVVVLRKFNAQDLLTFPARLFTVSFSFYRFLLLKETFSR